MYALKTPSLFRPSSRPASPVPAPTRQEHNPASDRSSRTTMLSFANFKRNASPLTAPPATLVQDGSYMEGLNLKLSEAVSKALAQPAGPGAPSELLNGRRPIPSGRGRALGEIIVSEIKASSANAHLSRAIIRTLHRPLSVLVTNMSSNLLPLLSSPAFLSPPAPSVQAPNPNATQLHALGYATCAGELLDIFDEIGLGQESDMRGDGLKVIREGLLSIVKRVIEPLVNGIKSDMMPHIEALEKLPVVPVKAIGSSKAVAYHPSITHLQTIMPVYARTLTRYIVSSHSESALATLLISLVWRGLVALSHRESLPVSPPASPALTAITPKPTSKDAKRRGSSVTPPPTPPSTKFALRLPPSRPPSPPGGIGSKGISVANDAKALYDLLASLPQPSGNKESQRIAKEVVVEAFQALEALSQLLDTIKAHQLVVVKSGLEDDLTAVTADLPLLAALPVLLRTYIFPAIAVHPALITRAPVPGAAAERSVASMLGLSEEAYRSGCLSGFGRAEDCSVAVGQRVLALMQDELATSHADERLRMNAFAVLRWLEGQVSIAMGEQQPIHH